MADFPTGYFAPRTTENLPGTSYDATQTKIQYAEDYSLPAAEILAIETALGLNPQGAYDTVSARIAALEAGGVAVWGGITGTLSDQTDLQDALDALGLAIGNPISSGSQGDILFVDADGKLGQSSGLQWNDESSFLGVGGPAGYPLHVYGLQNNDSGFLEQSRGVGTWSEICAALGVPDNLRTLILSGDIECDDMKLVNVNAGKAMYFSESTSLYAYYDGALFLVGPSYGSEDDSFLSDEGNLLGDYSGQGTYLGQTINVATTEIGNIPLATVLGFGNDANTSDITNLGTLSSEGGAGNLGYASNGFTNLFIEHIFDPAGNTSVETNTRQLLNGTFATIDWNNLLLSADDGAGAAASALGWSDKNNLQIYSGDAGNMPVDAVSIQKFIQVLDSAGTVFFLPLYQ